MISEINIKNFAITDNVNINFKNGLTVITGETGAGKSIIIKAISILLSERVNSNVIKHGKEKAEISATFNIKNLNNLKEKIKEAELYDDDNPDEMIIRKVITKSGKKTFVNGIQVKNTIVTSLVENLINIHSQKEHLNLLKSDYQLELLDTYANNKDIKESVYNLSKNIKKLAKKIIESKEKIIDEKNKIELLKYKYEQIKEAQLKENEYEEIENRYNEIKNSSEYLNSAKNVIDIFFENEFSIISMLSKSLKEIDGIQKLYNVQELINQAIINIEETKNELNVFLNSLDINEDEENEINERINIINKIAKKFNLIPEKIYLKTIELKKEIDSFSLTDENIDEMEKKLIQLKEKYKKESENLTKSRMKFIKVLSKDVNSYLEKLNIKENAFDIKIEKIKEEYSENGNESVLFVFCPNPGSPYAELGKIASGGELSRVSLSIQLALSKVIMFQTMIFDEVDTGVGGKTAAEIGIMLKEIGKTAQVICITHQAQVASKGNNHILIKKELFDNETKHDMITLNEKEREDEIVRMLSSDKITETTVAYAKDLLKG